MAPAFANQGLPVTQKAVVAKSVGKYELISTHALPILGPKHLMVKVFAVALNPVNWKMIDASPPLGVVGGNDYSGVISSIGVDVSSAWKIGDRVCGCVYGLDPTLEGTEWAGSFAEYIAVDASLVMRVPTLGENSMSMDRAASLGIGVMTAGMALYESLQLPMPLNLEIKPAERGSTSEFILIHGGNTATGTIAIQLARLSVFPPLFCFDFNNSSLTFETIDLVLFLSLLVLLLTTPNSKA
jgi:aspyridone synthetase trans-acting enoyl reductase